MHTARFIAAAIDEENAEATSSFGAIGFARNVGARARRIERALRAGRCFDAAGRKLRAQRVGRGGASSRVCVGVARWLAT